MENFATVQGLAKCLLQHLVLGGCFEAWVLLLGMFESTGGGVWDTHSAMNRDLSLWPRLKSLCVEQVGSKKLSFHACSFPILIPYFKAPRIETGGPTQSARAQFNRLSHLHLVSWSPKHGWNHFSIREHEQQRLPSSSAVQKCLSASHDGLVTVTGGSQFQG